MQEFGRLVLNKNPENFQRDVESAAFSPGSMIPGIEDSPDYWHKGKKNDYAQATEL
ncbi:uncharacterized protein M421DRAFT_423342 [Didymella exigua CBS 183.55]|uniref:Catalase core domain-containing protein n=1 Tax=Didymella exigua CBS 183.55 TaxID=1150837 RepID=A0A6A5RC09_9PLEO|nr:uncharacterized protein M421DRAFT_423342 [Didymella exigua CBS 183.55]KAF1925785.1 hypothetical protein M421DRAFT_423342 [Didymella exigua CBS 183.55]